MTFDGLPHCLIRSHPELPETKTAIDSSDICEKRRCGLRRMT